MLGVAYAATRLAFARSLASAPFSADTGWLGRPRRACLVFPKRFLGSQLSVTRRSTLSNLRRGVALCPESRKRARTSLRETDEPPCEGRVATGTLHCYPARPLKGTVGSQTLAVRYALCRAIASRNAAGRTRTLHKPPLESPVLKTQGVGGDLLTRLLSRAAPWSGLYRPARDSTARSISK